MRLPSIGQIWTYIALIVYQITASVQRIIDSHGRVEDGVGYASWPRGMGGEGVAKASIRRHLGRVLGIVDSEVQSNKRFLC